MPESNLFLPSHSNHIPSPLLYFLIALGLCALSHFLFFLFFIFIFRKAPLPPNIKKGNRNGYVLLAQSFSVGIIMANVSIAARNPRTPIMNPPNDCSPPGAPKGGRLRPEQSTPKTPTPPKTQDGSSSTVEEIANDINGLGLSGIGDHLGDVGLFFYL
jgi:hypothetical protein